MAYLEKKITNRNIYIYKKNSMTRRNITYIPNPLSK